MKKILIGCAMIWGSLAIVFYISSLNRLDSQTARTLGVSTTINIQGTVFCAACAVICCINAVGAMIVSVMEADRKRTVDQVQKTIEQTPSAIENEARERKILSEGGWRCPNCGMVNPKNVSSCGCGNLWMWNKNEM